MAEVPATPFRKKLRQIQAVKKGSESRNQTGRRPEKKAAPSWLQA